MKKLILASTSPRRKELMELLRLPFEAVASDYEEDMTLDMSPKELVKYLALGKAKVVADKLEDGLVIGGDTIVVFDGKVLGKPHTPEKAKEMLEMLRGSTHQIMSGIAIVDSSSNETKTDVSISNLTFKDISDEEIENYIKTGEPLDRAGAYALQGYASLFVDEIKGDYYGILGLSVVQLTKLLKEFGVDVWESIASK